MSIQSLSRNGVLMLWTPDDHALVQVIIRQRPERMAVFTGLTLRQFDKLVHVVAAGGHC
jgi:hypothetical protein